MSLTYNVMFYSLAQILIILKKVNLIIKNNKKYLFKCALLIHNHATYIIKNKCFNRKHS